MLPIVQVRGDTYLDDGKKVAPGPAMSKLMLLELYEVEAGDGDRHDHIVSRGKAKQRLEALRTLPEELFFFILNFQIPGDPPVSIVSYFAVPLDLMERHPSRATAKFLEMFERFVDAPRTERERYAAWGVSAPPEVDPPPVEAETEADEDDDADAEAEAEQQLGVDALEMADADDAEVDAYGDCAAGPASAEPSASSSSSGATAEGGEGTSAPDVPAGTVPASVPSDEQTSAGAGGNPAATTQPNGMVSPYGTYAIYASPAPLQPQIASNGAPSSSSSGSSSGGGHKSSLSSKAKKIVKEAAGRFTHYVIGQPTEQPPPPHAPGHASTAAAAEGGVGSVDGAAPAGVSEGAAGGSPAKATQGTAATANLPSSSPAASAAATASASAPSPASLPTNKVLRTPAKKASPAATSATPATPPADAAAPPASPALSPLASPAPSSTRRSSSWLPTDIIWPGAEDRGALPPTDFRNERFKLIPSITAGPWVVRAAVRNTPALLGKKVVQRYFRGDDYLEIDVHVGYVWGG